MFRQLTAAALATLALAACEPTTPTSNDPYSTIPTGDYVLFNIGGEVLSVRHTTMTISPTQMTGRTGCNNFVVPVSGTPPEFVAGEIQTAGLTCRWSAQETKFFNALRQANKISYEDGVLRFNAACKSCRLCVKNGPPGAVIWMNEAKPALDKSAWRGVAVFAERREHTIHPVTLELLGKAKELACVTREPVYALLIGSETAQLYLPN